MEELIISEDLKKAFKQNKNAEINYSNFSNSSKKQILFWIASAKRAETRKRRIEKTVEMALQNEKPGVDLSLFLYYFKTKELSKNL